MPVRRFSVGDTVRWTVSGNCILGDRVRTGTVVAVIPPYKRATEVVQGLNRDGGPRDHESYVTHVPSKTGRGKGSYYWPRTANISKAKNKA